MRLAFAASAPRRFGWRRFATHLDRPRQHTKAPAQPLQSDAPVERLTAALGRRHRQLGGRMGEADTAGCLVAMLSTGAASGEVLLLALGEQSPILERKSLVCRFLLG